MSHHFKSAGAYSIDDLASFVNVGDLQLLLEKNGSLLVRGLDNAFHEHVVWGRGGWVEERKEIDRLCAHISHL